jgi:hypothetical protein
MSFGFFARSADHSARDVTFRRSCKSLGREVVHAAMMSALVSSIANSAENGDRSRTLPLSAFIPPEPRVFPMVLQRLTPLILGEESIATLHIFFSSLAFARNIATLIDIRHHDVKHDPHKLAMLAASWRRVCHHGMLAIHEMETLLANIGESGDVMAWRAQLLTLEQASNGDSPCIDSDGRIAMAYFPDNRRFPRFSVRKLGTISVRDTCMPVLIRDISQSGCGFDVQTALAKGSRMEIRLCGARTLSGRIAWSHATGAGLEFDHQLGPLDELIAEFNTA